MSPLFTHTKIGGLLQVKSWGEKTWLFHGFTTRQAGDFSTLDPVPDAMKSWGAGSLSLAAVRQTHSDLVHVSDTVPAHADRPEADAILSRRSGQLLSVRTADCLPLLFVDEQRRAVGAIHAGWRGTAKHIAMRALERMRAEFGSRPEDLEIAIGPGIGVCCYEVGADVADQFPASSIRAGRRPHLDLVSENRRQLVASGVSGGRIHAVSLCTHCRPDLFHSHRRDGAAAGRMMAVIGICSTELRNSP